MKKRDDTPDEHPAKELAEIIRQNDATSDVAPDPSPEGGGGVKADEYVEDQPVEEES
jgi:hypothetical protein